MRPNASRSRSTAAAPSAACAEAPERLDRAGVEVSASGAEAAGPRLLVGPWARVRADPIAARLDDGPATSGVFARFERDGDRWTLAALDRAARPSRMLAAGAGLVAGLRRGDEPATWLVTGTDAAGAERAARLLDADALAQRYAVATDGAEIPLPDGEAG